MHIVVTIGVHDEFCYRNDGVGVACRSRTRDRKREGEYRKGDAGKGTGSSHCHLAMRRAALLVVTLGLTSPKAYAATALFSLAIGYNGLPPGPRAAGVGVLSFADDDALAVHELARTVARRSVVLALSDRATQARYPSSAAARPPSLAELRRALAELGADIEHATRAGDEAAVWFFYSGHGWLDDDGRANLTLADGALSQDMLYNEVLPALPGRTVHLMIDACHAEAMIRPRDANAETVEVSAAEVASASLRSRLAQLPSVGVIMASASNTLSPALIVATELVLTGF